MNGRGREWFRVVMTAAGLVGTALATVYVIRTGVSATTESTPRTVVATIAPADSGAQPKAATRTADAWAGLERPIMVTAPTPAALPAVDLRRVVYTVAGNQRFDDPVTIVYADETGTLQRAENVTLPWTLTVTPNVPVNYVTASSRGSQLNCWITDAGGSTVAAQTDFSTSVTCNR
ncbi:MAG: hypothetical protein FGM50_10665 [Mycobacterium sp.]|nr:hypothetical protein [Mycobacterium sp.]